MRKVCVICKCIFDTFYIHIPKFGDGRCEITESMLVSLQEADDDEPGLASDMILIS